MPLYSISVRLVRIRPLARAVWYHFCMIIWLQKIRFCFYLAIILGGYFLLLSPALAQSLGTETNISIIANPRFPEPAELVTLSLNAYTIDTNGGSIRWFIDGTELVSATNNRSVELLAPGAGETSKVTAQIITRTGQTIPVSYTLRPLRVDLIVEAKTLTPSFYQGRALPSTDSIVRVVALPQIANTKPQDYSYVWRLNNKVLFGGSVRGKHIADFSMPMGRDVVVGVDVIGPTGEVIASDSSVIPAVQPELYFYPDNPLRGISRTALPKIYNLIGAEVDVRAEPYYMDEAIFSSNPLLEWSINGVAVDNPNDDQQTLTLQNGGGGAGSFTISFHIRNLNQLLQGIEDDFTLRF